MNIHGDWSEKRLVRSANVGGNEGFPANVTADGKPLQGAAVDKEPQEQSNKARLLCDGATEQELNETENSCKEAPDTAPNTEPSHLHLDEKRATHGEEEVPKSSSWRCKQPDECGTEREEDNFFTALSAGIMPLPSTRSDAQTVLDYRSGFPGAFGVGDIAPFASECRLEHDFNAAARTSSSNSISPDEDTDNLVRATPVSTDGELALQQAIPDSSGQHRQNRSFLWHVILGVLCLSVSIAVAIGGVCVTGFCTTGPYNQPTSGFTPAPTSLRSTLSRDFQERFMETFGSSYFEVEDDYLLEARLQALDWIITTDTVQLELDAENLMQRFILAVFYYQTTRYHPWKDCNPPEAGQASTCYYVPMLLESNQEPILGNRWLSEVHECFWAGVSCFGSSNKNVTEITLRHHNLNGALPTELSKLEQFSSLQLNNNAISGTLPSELGGLRTSLSQIDLAKNSIHGTIPQELFEKLERTWSFYHFLATS